MHRISLKASGPLSAALSVAALLAGCAPIATGGPPLALASGLAGQVHVGSIDFDLQAPLNDVSESFRETFQHEVGWTLTDCARGPQLLDLRIRLDGVKRVQPITAARSGGAHHLSGVAEFLEPKTHAVVGRYPVEVDVDTGRGLGALLTDQEAEMSEAFARDLCRQARLSR